MKEKRFGDIAEFINGRAFKPEDWGTKGLPIIRIQNLTGTNESYNYFEGEFDKRYLVKNDDILISWSASLGVYRWNKEDAILNQHIFKVDLKNEIDKTFFYYAAQEKLIEMERQVHGSTMKHITKDKFDNIKVFVPDLKTQKKIAAILEKADGARQKRRQANQLTTQFLQSAFLKMFGDRKYPYKKLGEFVIETEQVDPLKEPHRQFKYIDIQSIDNKQGVITETKEFLGKDAPSRARKVVKSGDVIVSTVRPNLNATAIVPQILDGQLCSTGFCVLRTNGKMNNEFLFAYTRLKMFVEQLVSKTKGASYPAVNNSDVLDVNIPAPPLSEQQKFASLVERVETLRTKQRQSEQELENLFQSLMQQAFSGKLPPILAISQLLQK